MAEAAEPLRISTLSMSLGLRSAIRLSGFSCDDTEIPLPEARVTLFVPEAIAMSLTMTPSMT